jgi:hypothetical protein
MQATVEAYNESDAKERIRDKVVFYAVREEAKDDAGDMPDFLRGIFGKNNLGE